MTKKKYTNDVLAGNGNGGLHSTRRLNTLNQFFTTHDLKQAVLYQFILSGSTKDEYQATMKAIIRHVRTKCRAEYIGAYEVGDEKGGLHAHAFVIIETAKHFPSDLLDVSEGQWIARRIKRKAKEAKEAGAPQSLSIRIEPPKNPMHGGAMFARMNTPEKLADAMKWASYCLKVRSKDDVPGRETYFGSEFAANIAKREAQRQKHRDALTKSTKKPVEQVVEAPEPTNNDKGNEMIVTNLTPAGFTYLAKLYEQAVTEGMDVGQIHTFLSRKGVAVTKAEVIDHLDNVFTYHGYAAANPAKPAMSYEEFDAQMRKPARRLPSKTDGSKLVSSEPASKQPRSLAQKVLDSSSDLAHN